jgi:bifunctional pyridoxal-dependent enzyme with beta-cystathionase and maltose regulon repressor activities
MYILNIAAGNIFPIDKKEKTDILVNLDLNYFNSITVQELEKFHRENPTSTITNNIGNVIYINHDIYEFLERYTERFDKVVIYRFLEHVPKVKVLYFLYMLSTVMKIGAEMDVIVPNYKILAERILNEDVSAPNFEAEDIITTFELLNEPSCPHGSVWTEDRVKHFIELEGRFKVTFIDPKFNFDGRDIYLRFKAERIK